MPPLTEHPEKMSQMMALMIIKECRMKRVKLNEFSHSLFCTLISVYLASFFLFDAWSIFQREVYGFGDGLNKWLLDYGFLLLGLIAVITGPTILLTQSPRYTRWSIKYTPLRIAMSIAMLVGLFVLISAIIDIGASLMSIALRFLMG